MTQTELSDNLNVLIKHFEELKEKAQTTQEYTETHMAVITLEQAQQSVELLANLSYIIKYIARME
jgi:hypothetical protein